VLGGPLELNKTCARKHGGNRREHHRVLDFQLRAILVSVLIDEPHLTKTFAFNTDLESGGFETRNVGFGDRSDERCLGRCEWRVMQLRT
jgi:hypothetical protein